MFNEPKIINRKLAYKGKAFDIYKYSVQIEGRELKRDIIERAHGVVVVPIDINHEVLLISEYCAGSNSFILSLPGGSIEDINNIENEALRELREETGYTAKKIAKLHYAYGHPSTSTRRSYCFLGYDLEWKPLSSTEEIIQVVKIPLQEAIVRVYKDFESDVSTIGNLLMARDKLTELNW